MIEELDDDSADEAWMKNASVYPKIEREVQPMHYAKDETPIMIPHSHFS